jgi:catechol 2,3-dioxygenase-like lactoylglutathione lyase family enzyme
MANSTSRKNNAVRRKTKRTIEFNHAMVYTNDLRRSLAFYRDTIGFKLLDMYPDAYARLRSPSGTTTIALHVVEPGQRMDPATGGLRLYFEVQRLSTFCRSLRNKGVLLDQEPKKMPWGWTHAYLRDPDGHEISLYSAGPARLRKHR